MRNRIGIKFSTGPYCWFTPQEDITTFELAQVMTLFFNGFQSLSWEHAEKCMTQLFEDNPAIRRHFEVSDKTSPTNEV